MSPRATNLPGGGLEDTKGAVREAGRSRAVTGRGRGPRALVPRVRLAPATTGLPWGPWPGWWETATKGTHAGTRGLGNRPARQANDGSKDSKYPKRNGPPFLGQNEVPEHRPAQTGASPSVSPWSRSQGAWAPAPAPGGSRAHAPARLGQDPQTTRRRQGVARTPLCPSPVRSPEAGTEADVSTL